MEVKSTQARLVDVLQFLLGNSKLRLLVRSILREVPQLRLMLRAYILY